MMLFCCRLTLSSVDKDGNEVYRKATEIRKIGLGKDEVKIMLIIFLL